MENTATRLALTALRSLRAGGIQRLGETLLDVYAPRLCCFCALPCRPIAAHDGADRAAFDAASAICSACFHALERNTDACPYCALPHSFGARCPECFEPRGLETRGPDLQRLKSRRLPCRVIAPFVYDANIAYFLRRWKFEKQRYLSDTAAIMLLNSTIDANLYDSALATPLHWQRHLLRGFNQSDDLLRAAARRSPELGSLHRRSRHAPRLRRCRATNKQSLAGRRERRRNLAGAFQVDGRFHGESVLIVDDVCTTGETARAMSRALLEAGAGEVTLLCLARTPSNLPVAAV
jgi:ComF family protein